MLADVDFGKMPVHFVPNRGQLDKQVAYHVQGKDKTLYFTAEGITMALAMPAPEKATEASAPAEGRYVVKLDFVGANRGVKPVGEEKTDTVISYFKGEPGDWEAGLPTYSKIVYRDLWPGIDLVYRGTADRLKYEFIVHPGADPSMIRLAYRGAEGISVDKAGRLNVSTPAGGFLDDVPVAYQETDGRKKEVELAYDDLEKDIYAYGFDIGAYDPAQTLVLDPAIFIYCGYIGGASEDYGRGIAVDDTGNVYIVGETLSPEAGFPLAVGPDLTENGSFDAFVAKIDPAGTGLVYCGYIGGAGEDRGYAIAVDGAGSAYITGYTTSPESSFPVTVGPDLTYNPGSQAGVIDVFVAKINSAGTALAYCGYIGGSGPESGYGIAVDASGSAYVTGYTQSVESTFPVAVGPDLTANGSSDAFVAKVNPSGAFLDYCGYIGGQVTEIGYGIAVDGSGHAYITGQTTSNETTFPVVIGPALTTGSYAGRVIAFIAKLTPDGAGLAYSGFISGTRGDRQDGGHGVAVDRAGCAWVTGFYDSSYGTKAILPNGFVSKVTADGSALASFFRIDGRNVLCYAAAVDSSGSPYIAGYAESLTTTTEGPDITYNAGGDAFVAKLNAAGTAFVYCGFIGGSTYDEGRGIAVDSSGNAYVVGSTQSGPSSFPVCGRLNPVYSGLSDAFVAKIAFYETRILRNCVGDFDGDGADEAAVDFGQAGAWMFNGGVWSQLAFTNTEGLTAADVDGDGDDEIVADLGAGGLWLWSGPGWNEISVMNAETTLAADLDADGSDELIADFGALGLWVWNGGGWTQISAVNALLVASAGQAGGSAVVADFGAVGLWYWLAGSWTELAPHSVSLLTTGNYDGLAGEDVAGDFGDFGLWFWDGSSWIDMSPLHADQAVALDADGDLTKELAGDFGVTGLWLWKAGAWSALSGANAERAVAADVDGNGNDDLAADFGTLGLWLRAGGAWNQISGMDAENILKGDFDGDHQAELMVDFGPSGLWLWNGGAWSEINVLNPDQVRGGRAVR